MRAIAWTTISLLALIGIVVLVNEILDTEAYGATFRVALNGIIFAIAATARVIWEGILVALIAVQKSLQGLLTLIAVVFKRRAFRIAASVTPIGYGYLGSVFLSETRMRHLYKWMERFKMIRFRLKKGWIALPVWLKLLVVVAVIALQIALFPKIAQYILLFPLRFMVSVIVGIFKRIYGMIADTFVGQMYWKYCGKKHRAVVRHILAFTIVRLCSGAIRTARMQYLTAWRLWKYNKRYRDESGELWISFLEPVRLWRRKELNVYIGKPLFAKRETVRVLQAA